MPGGGFYADRTARGVALFLSSFFSRFARGQKLPEYFVVSTALAVWHIAVCATAIFSGDVRGKLRANSFRTNRHESFAFLIFTLLRGNYFKIIVTHYSVSTIATQYEVNLIPRRIRAKSRVSRTTKHSAKVSPSSV